MVGPYRRMQEYKNEVERQIRVSSKEKTAAVCPDKIHTRAVHLGPQTTVHSICGQVHGLYGPTECDWTASSGPTSQCSRLWHR